MQGHGRGIEGKIAIGNDPGVMPSLARVILHNKHMIGKIFAEPEVIVIGPHLAVGRIHRFDRDFHSHQSPYRLNKRSLLQNEHRSEIEIKMTWARMKAKITRRRSRATVRTIFT